MSSRDTILAAIRNNQPSPSTDLPVLPQGAEQIDHCPRFMKTLEAIGGHALLVKDFASLALVLKERFAGAQRIVTGCPELMGKGIIPEPELNPGTVDPHSLENIDVAVLRAHFGVAENGACWITEDRMIQRVVPFICQHLVLVIDKKDIVANMHEAYGLIRELEGRFQSAGVDGFATFIAGPSKTADIEQSLVLGAHGPVSMTVFLLDEGVSDEGFF